MLSAELPHSLVAIIVIENGPKLGIKKIVEEYAAKAAVKIEYRYCAIPNKSAALNLALTEMTTEWLVFFDDDITVQPESLLAYENAISKNFYSRKYFYGGPFTCHYEVEPLPWVRPFLPRSAQGWDAKDEEWVYPDMPFMGSNWAASAESLSMVGGFDPKFGPGSTVGGTGQEFDMQSRLLRAGHKPVLVRNAAISHYVPSENCSPGWCLERAYKNGIASGFRTACSGKSITSVLLWHIRSLLMNLVKALFRGKANFKKESGFKTGMLVTNTFGILVGVLRYLKSN